jgi:hypothetical protein
MYWFCLDFGSTSFRVLHFLVCHIEVGLRCECLQDVTLTCSVGHWHLHGLVQLRMFILSRPSAKPHPRSAIQLRFSVCNRRPVFFSFCTCVRHEWTEQRGDVVVAC